MKEMAVWYINILLLTLPCWDFTP